jgi:hypothetical protein
MRSRGVTSGLAGARMALSMSAERRRQPTERRQDKRPAAAAAYVVVWIRDFPASAPEPAGADRTSPNTFNAPSAIAMLMQEFPA